MRAEMAEQPGVLEHALEAELPAPVSRVLLAEPMDGIVFLGRGSSGWMAAFAARLGQAVCAVPVWRAAVSVSRSTPPRGALASRVVCIAISQSGKTDDVIEAACAWRDAGSFTVALTNDSSSELADALHAVIPMGAGTEQAIPATKTVMATLGLVARLAFELSGRPAGAGLTRRLVSRCDETLRIDSAIEDVAAAIRPAHQVIHLAAGLLVPIGGEGALKVAEVTGRAHIAASPEEWLHGPWAGSARRADTILIYPSVEAAARPVQVLEAQLAGTEASVLLLPRPPGPLLQADVDAGLELAVVSLVRAQQLALRLGLGDGVDPDRPPLLSKVGQTLRGGG